MKTNKIIYWTATILMCLLFIYSAQMYIFNYEMVKGFFTSLGFPTWLVYPLAILKIAGVITILTKYSKFLKELAYAGFLYDAILALMAHKMVDDGGHMAAVIAIILIIVSWYFDRKVFNS
ncbi:MAG: hypothetical protein BM557_07690 [Flavobacterium sp. MedPE-SWcel]|uniref:DoxX family protein n=1 Tax=uncultured Flavobacterium sp. TaxID=165435 RepID=UPI0009221C04|nr:DoxX family protein [uncultured Flavobacterium sp.]OIQ18089.1 MAG: hypothetical protein BM557_07690 [Flavobacterium sp. MedPE-SWcel]